MNIAFEKRTLSNGLDVILHVDHSVPVAAVNLWYHVGSQNEEPDRTGFAHLFEHIMFEGSKNHNHEYFAPFQEVGANINGSTTVDRTNYYEDVPAEYLELALWLESDRMGFLLDALTDQKFEIQRDVVKNERRQSYENRPYGLSSQEIRKALFPPQHPYHWQTIGSMEHLSAASLDDVKAFFRRFYAPNNASLAIAGDIDVEEAMRLAQKYFGDLPPAPPVERVTRWLPRLDDEVRLELEDSVQLQRIYFAWLAPPRFDADEAPLDVLMSILGEGRSSRLYRSMVYEKQIAREAGAYYAAMEIAGEIRLDATIAPGATVAQVETSMLEEIERMKSELPTQEEVQRAVNRLEAHYVGQLEHLGGFGGRADLLNFFNTFTGDPGRLNVDFDRYTKVTPEDVRRVANDYLTPARVRLVISPKKEVSAVEVDLDRAQKPSPGQPRRFQPPVPQRLSIAGGLDLLVVEKHEVPLIAAGVYFGGGAVHDPADRPGLTSFMGRLLVEGTKTRSSTEISDEGDFIAARPNVGVDREDIVVSTEALTHHWPRALALLADVIANPVFPENEVERVRKERLTDLRRLKDDANAIAERVANGLLYGRETEHGHPISGREAAVEAMLRDEIVNQHERLILRGKPTFLIVGDITAVEVAKQIEAAFAGWGATETPPSVAADMKRGQTTIYLVDKPAAPQSVIAAGHVTVPRLHPDYMPLTVMNMAFGGQFTARLNMNLREDKGYTYGYRSRFDWRKAVSNFSAGGSVQTDVTSEAMFETLKEFRDLQSVRPIAEDEFEKSRSGLVRGFPPTFETPSQVLRRLLDIVHFGLPDDYFSGQVARLEAVTLADVRRVASEHVDPEALSIVVVGDRATIEAPLRRLELPIVLLDAEGLPLE
ncbi:MAG TPA: pitrilysin family protein [Dehalococcoidia bacterium]|nr:pitrilysin family protein [Dehalococcoidia bacterium]